MTATVINIDLGTKDGKKTVLSMDMDEARLVYNKLHDIFGPKLTPYVGPGLPYYVPFQSPYVSPVTPAPSYPITPWNPSWTCEVGDNIK